MLRIILMILLAACAANAKTNATENATGKKAEAHKVEKQKEKKTEHMEAKIIVKERDKGSKKESDYTTAREFPLMFKNNRNARSKK